MENLNGLEIYAKTNKGVLTVVGCCALGYRLLTGIEGISNWRKELKAYSDLTKSMVETASKLPPISLEEFVAWAHSLDNDPIIKNLESQLEMARKEEQKLTEEVYDCDTGHHYLEEAERLRAEATKYEDWGKAAQGLYEELSKKRQEAEDNLIKIKILLQETKVRLAPKE